MIYIYVQALGSTVLHNAVYGGNSEIVKVLLLDKRFTEVNAEDNVSDSIVVFVFWHWLLIRMAERLYNWHSKPTKLKLLLCSTNSSNHPFNIYKIDAVTFDLSSVGCGTYITDMCESG